MVEQVFIKRSKLFTKFPPSVNRMCSVTKIFIIGQLFAFHFQFFIFVLRAAYVTFSKWGKSSPQITPKIVFFSIYVRPDLFSQLLLNKVQQEDLFVMHVENKKKNTEIKLLCYYVTLGCSKIRLCSNLYKTGDCSFKF